MKIVFAILVSFIFISSSFSQQEKQTPHNFQEEVKILYYINLILLRNIIINNIIYKKISKLI